MSVINKPDNEPVKLDVTIARRMTPQERTRFRRVSSQLADYQWDTMPKQEAVLDYVRAVMERDELRVGLAKVREVAIAMPRDKDNVRDLQVWMGLVSRLDQIVIKLRNAIGLNAQKETDLNNAVRIKGAPKGGHEIKPWDNV